MLVRSMMSLVQQDVDKCACSLCPMNVSEVTDSQTGKYMKMKMRWTFVLSEVSEAQAVPVLEELHASLEFHLLSTTTDISPTLEPVCELEETRRYERL